MIKIIIFVTLVFAQRSVDIWQGHWGDWKPTVFSPSEEMLACGASLRVQPKQGSKGDDT